jgi:hypothetical protein
MGTPEQVSLHLNGVAGHLASLPVDRIQDEAQVLRIEDSGRGPTQVGLDLSVRFGPRGVGLLGWPEHGLRRLQDVDVIAWVHRWFTKNNAVLWFSGPIPEDLDL